MTEPLIRSDVAEVLAVIQAGIPGFDVDAERIVVWHDALNAQGVSIEAAVRAARAWVTTEEWGPKLAQFLDVCEQAARSIEYETRPRELPAAPLDDAGRAEAERDAALTGVALARAALATRSRLDLHAHHDGAARCPVCGPAVEHRAAVAEAGGCEDRYCPVCPLGTPALTGGVTSVAGTSDEAGGCPECDGDLWVELADRRWRPCEQCSPTQFDRWVKGMYRAGFDGVDRAHIDRGKIRTS